MASPVPTVHPLQKGHSQVVCRGIVAVTAGTPRAGGCREPDWVLHRSEHLLCAEDRAPGTALQEVAGAVRRRRPPQATVTWQCSIRLQSPEVIHCEESHEEWDVCSGVFYLAQSQRCEFISPYSCSK